MDVNPGEAAAAHPPGERPRAAGLTVVAPAVVHRYGVRVIKSMTGWWRAS
jgi:hypothetical protein